MAVTLRGGETCTGISPAPSRVRILIPSKDAVDKIPHSAELGNQLIIILNGKTRSDRFSTYMA